MNPFFELYELDILDAFFFVGGRNKENKYIYYLQLKDLS